MRVCVCVNHFCLLAFRGILAEIRFFCKFDLNALSDKTKEGDVLRWQSATRIFTVSENKKAVISKTLRLKTLVPFELLTTAVL